MHPLFITCLDIIFPPRTEELCVRTLTHENVLAMLTPVYVDEVHALTSFSEPSIAALIHEAKFHQNKKAIGLLGNILATYLLSHTVPTDRIILPLPLSKERARERGYNQVSEIVRSALTKTHAYQIDEHLIVRSRDTKPQSGLNRSERLENVRGAFEVLNGTSIRNQHILLIDDVVTTGATLRAAKAAILPHSPASITCIALAH